MNRRQLITRATAFALGSAPTRALAQVSNADALRPSTAIGDRLQTRAERTSYAETSTNQDVERLLHALDERGAPIVPGVLGLSSKGRPIPYLVASRPSITDGAQAHAARKPVVFVLAGGRANEPDGKEALLAVVRDLAIATGHTLLEDMVVVAIPNYDVDGNADLGPVALRNPSLDGPARVGAPYDGIGVDLTGDFIGLRTSAARQLVDLAKLWNPDVFVDLRTGGTSFTTFAVTDAPALNPAAFYGGTYARDTMLPVLHQQMREKFGVDTFFAGGFGRNAPLAYPRPGVELGWFAPDDSARLVANYFGIRGATAVTAYAFPHDEFERRVFALRAYLGLLLQYCSDQSDALLSRTKMAANWTTGAIPLRTHRDPRPSQRALISWQTPTVDTTPAKHPMGLEAGLALAGRFETSLTPVFDRYVGTLYAQQPYAYLLDAASAPLARQLLARHGIRTQVVAAGMTFTGETFTPTRVLRSVVFGDSRLGGVTEAGTVTVDGTWRRERIVAAAGAELILGQQPLGPLVSILLEPQSENGLASARVFDTTLAVGRPHVVRRVVGPASA